MDRRESTCCQRQEVTITGVEAGIVLSARPGIEPQAILDRFLRDFGVVPVVFGEQHWREALDAFRRFGKGRHPASLNFGDCLSYAAARVADKIERVRIAPGLTPVTQLDFVSYPYSHSLVAALGWSALVGAVYWLVRRNPRGSLVVGSLVFSHWALDFVTHIPDLPLAPGGAARVGLGLWRSLPATLAVELLIFFGGLALYARSTAPRDRAGRWGLWGLVAFLLVAYLAAVFGPLPPSVTAIAWGGQAIWLLVLWGYWVDRHRARKEALRAS